MACDATVAMLMFRMVSSSARRLRVKSCAIGVLGCVAFWAAFGGSIRPARTALQGERCASQSICQSPGGGAMCFVPHLCSSTSSLGTRWKSFRFAKLRRRASAAFPGEEMDDDFDDIDDDDDIYSELERHFESLKQLEYEDRARDDYETTTKLEHATTVGVITQFGTPIYRSPLRSDGDEMAALNMDVTREADVLRDVDEVGRVWSQENYPGGYTSFGSNKSLNKIWGSAQKLERWLEPHVRAFNEQIHSARACGTPELSMSECWINVMGNGTTHGFHTHDHAKISGTYYVKTPVGCSRICFEDPRVDMMVATSKRQLIEYPVHAGDVILFPSWLRHKVPPNNAGDDRISVSFNYVDLSQTGGNPSA